jgi:hypothetical protein
MYFVPSHSAATWFHPIVVKSGADSTWAALAFGASILVAAFTGWLALQTRRLAQQTEADVSAQWRPVIVFRHAKFVVPPAAALGEIRCSVRNAGAGVAINATVFIDFGPDGQGGPIGIGTVIRDGIADPVVPTIPFHDRNEWVLVSQYEDLAGNRFETRMTLSDAARNVKAQTDASKAADAAIGLTDTVTRALGRALRPLETVAEPVVVTGWLVAALRRASAACDWVAVRLSSRKRP